MDLESDMLSCLVFSLVLPLQFLLAEPDSLIKASDAVPKMALLDAVLNGESPAHGRRNSTYGVEDGGHPGNLVAVSTEVLCSSRCFIDPFSVCVVTISA
jgi:hypothetical protein